MSPKIVNARCPKSANPYVNCPLAIRIQDETVMSMVTSIVLDVKRLNSLSFEHETMEESRLIDSATREITAYINGRLQSAIDMLCEQDHALMYEDDLPENMSDSEYDEWFAKSSVVDGVRMGPSVSSQGK